MFTRLDKMDQSLNKTDYENSQIGEPCISISSKGIKLVAKNPPKIKHISDGFTDKFNYTFKVEIVPILYAK